MKTDNMNNITMKKFITLLVALLAAAAAVYADNDRAVSFDRLPDRAQAFLSENFPSSKLAYAKQERDFLEVHYEVVMVSGEKIEFDRRGEWTSIECRYARLDRNLVPEPIRAKVEEMYQGAEYREISRDRREYEVKISYGVELTFDRHFNLMGIDD